MNAIYKYTSIVLSLVLCNPLISNAQSTEEGLLWEISGNNLSSPSFLFGTFHLSSSRYVDSLTNVMDKFNSSYVVVSELLFDSTMTIKVMKAAQMPTDTTLDKLLSEQTYYETAQWLKELSGFDLKFFNNINPKTIQLILITLLQKKHFPLDAALDTPADLYLQKKAKENGKQLVGLELLEDQLHALYGQFSYSRQAELLEQFVKERDSATAGLIEMNRLYREGKLNELNKYLADESYSKEEEDVLLTKRNEQWLNVLPSLMENNSVFIAVGALHLPGEKGLINLLRTKGYSVKPLQLR